MPQKSHKDIILQERRRQKSKPEPLALYIHVPFCAQKCSYCDFYSKPCNGKKDMDAYAKAVCIHIEEYFKNSSKPEVATIYFGGGTPSMLEIKHIKSILCTIKKYSKLSENAEITLEGNPESSDYKFLRALRRLGVNRMSFGIQSAHDSELMLLGRLHNYSGAVDAVQNAKKAKFKNISVDLMYGLPNQTMEKWQESINEILALNVMHISAYALKIEEGTELYKALNGPHAAEYGQIPNDDLQADMYFYLVQRMQQSGYIQYEISNFAKEGYFSRHNSSYWDLSPYLGFGPSAHSFYGGRRFSFVASTEKYISGVQAGSNSQMELLESAEEQVDAPRHGEYIMLRMRTTLGVDEHEFFAKFKMDFSPYAGKLQKYLQDGYCMHENSRWYLTPKGFFVSNTIIADVLGEIDI